MKSWHQFSSMLMVAALVASATAAEQVTPWGYGPTAGAAAQTAAPGVALTSCQNGSCGGATSGAPAYGYGGQAYGAPGNGAPNYGAPNYGAPSYGAPAYGAPMAAQNYGGAPAYTASLPRPQQAQVPAYAGPGMGTPPASLPPMQSPAVTTYAAPSAANAYTAQSPIAQSSGVVAGPGCGGPAYSAPVATAPAFAGGYAATPANWGPPVVDCAVPVPTANNCPRWFGGVYGLIMDRVDSDNVYFATDPALPSRLYLSSRDASMDNAGGVEARIGKTFNCCRWGLEFVYWQLFPNDESASVYVANVPAPTMWMTTDYQDVYLNYGTGPDTIANYFDNGSIQTMEIRRSFDYQNFELNFLSGPLCPAPSSCCDDGGCGRGPCAGGRCGLGRYGANCGKPNRWQAGWVFGFRYFRADENFMLGVDNGDGFLDYTYNGGDEEFFHQIDTTNDLYGFQLGLNLNYCLTKCLQLEFGSKMGLYGNHMTSYQRIFNTTGPAYVDPAAPADFTVDTTENDIAFLGELRSGFGYKLGCHWRLTGGYRAVAVSNVALPLHQLPTGRTLGSLSHVGQINHDASLILHGAYAGLEFAW